MLCSRLSLIVSNFEHFNGWTPSIVGADWSEPWTCHWSYKKDSVNGGALSRVDEQRIRGANA